HPLHTLSLYSATPRALPALLPFPTRRSSDLVPHSRRPPSRARSSPRATDRRGHASIPRRRRDRDGIDAPRRHWRPPHPARLRPRSEEHTSELQSPDHLVCRLLLEKKKNQYIN